MTAIDKKLITMVLAVIPASIARNLVATLYCLRCTLHSISVAVGNDAMPPPMAMSVVSSNAPGHIKALVTVRKSSAAKK
jgi:hypothetical protein